MVMGYAIMYRGKSEETVRHRGWIGRTARTAPRRALVSRCLPAVAGGLVRELAGPCLTQSKLRKVAMQAI